MNPGNRTRGADQCVFIFRNTKIEVKGFDFGRGELRDDVVDGGGEVN